MKKKGPDIYLVMVGGGRVWYNSVECGRERNWLFCIAALYGWLNIVATVTTCEVTIASVVCACVLAYGHEDH